MHHDSATLLLALQRLLNDLSERAIHLDPVAAKNFTSLTGQVIEIHCLEPALTWHLTLQESSIEVHAGASNNPNVAVTGKPLGLLQMLMTGATSETVVIDGDAAVLMALQTSPRTTRQIRPNYWMRGLAEKRDSAPRRW